MTKRQKESLARKVARAIAEASPRAGESVAPTPRPESVAQRAKNLLDASSPYGAYVVPGDPYGWGGPLVTILMEQKGDAGDCVKPLDYYYDGIDVAHRASSKLDGYYIEFVNAAVAGVWEI